MHYPPWDGAAQGIVINNTYITRDEKQVSTLFDQPPRMGGGSEHACAPFNIAFDHVIAT